MAPYQNSEVEKNMIVEEYRRVRENGMNKEVGGVGGQKNEKML